MRNEKFEELKQKKEKFDKLKTLYKEVDRLKKIKLTALDDAGIKKYNDEVNSLLNETKKILTLSDDVSIAELWEKIMQEGKKLKNEITQEIPIVLNELNKNKGEIETKLESKPDNVNQLKTELIDINTIIKLAKSYQQEFNPTPQPKVKTSSQNSIPKKVIPQQRENKGYGTQSTYQVKSNQKINIENILDLPLTKKDIENIEIDSKITLKSFNDIVKEWEENTSKGLLLEELTATNYKTYLKLKIIEELFNKEIKSLEREISKNSGISSYEENKTFLFETYNKLGVKFENLKLNINIAHQLMENILHMYEGSLTILNQVTGKNKENFKFGIGGKVIQADALLNLYSFTTSKLEIASETIDKLNYLLLDLRKTKSIEYEKNMKDIASKEKYVHSLIGKVLYELGATSITNSEYDRIREFAELNGIDPEIVDIKGLDIINKLTAKQNQQMDYNEILENEIEDYEEENERDVFGN